MSYVLFIELSGGRNNFTDPTPGDLVACMTYVQRTLPIAVARPYVEQFVPNGTRVQSYHYDYSLMEEDPCMDHIPYMYLTVGLDSGMSHYTVKGV